MLPTRGIVGEGGDSEAESHYTDGQTETHWMRKDGLWLTLHSGLEAKQDWTLKPLDWNIKRRLWAQEGTGVEKEVVGRPGVSGTELRRPGLC